MISGRAKSYLQNGFTLLEILVAISLALIILFAATSLLITSSNSTGDLQNKNELLEESQIAQNYLAWRLKEAVYIFPVGTTLQLAAGSGYTTQNPVSKDGTWEVGQINAPIVAFIRPPEILDGTPCTSDEKACYQFVAYYLVLRSTWMSGATSYNRPANDPDNKDRWVLVELRKNYTSGPPALASLPTGATPTSYTPPTASSSGRLLLDYFQSSALALPNTPALFEYKANLDPDAAIWQQTAGNIAITINFALSRKFGKNVAYVPSRNAQTTGPTSVTPVVVSPINLGTLN